MPQFGERPPWTKGIPHMQRLGRKEGDGDDMAQE